ncbi:MAG: DUF4012 domain-containing protein [Jatrophihabitantaceae bacterium]
MLDRRVSNRWRLQTRLRYLLFDGRLRRHALIACGGVIALGALWIVVTGLLARQQARHVEADLVTVRSLVASGRIDEARQAAARIPSEARRADLLTSGPAWWLAAHVPYLGAPAETIRGATDATVQLGEHGIPDLLDVAKLMDPRTLRTSGDTIDLGALTTARPKLQAASAILDSAVRKVDGLPSGTWLGAVDSPRAALARELHGLSGYVDAAARAARILPPLLGVDGTRRYFVGVQNEAEARGTGGLPGAFAILQASHGTVRFTRFESDAALLPAATDKVIRTGLDFGAGYHAAYGPSEPTESFPDSDVSPNFPYAARIWVRMWERVSGEHLDGAIAVDPTVLGYLLAATGPVSVPTGPSRQEARVTAQNIVTLTERDEYTLFSDNNARKAFLVSVLKGASTKLTSGSGSPTLLVSAAVTASEQRRLLVWSADPAVEKDLAATSYGGVIAQDDRPLSAVILNNTSGGKLDFYLTRTLDYHRSGCGPTRDVLVTITLKNNAPASGLPPYVTDRLDAAPANSVTGDYGALLDYYATAGAQLLSITIDGTPATASSKSDLGHPIFRLPMELPRGRMQTIVLHLQEPAGSGSPQLWLQPTVSPPALHVYSQPCG